MADASSPEARRAGPEHVRGIPSAGRGPAASAQSLGPAKDAPATTQRASDTQAGIDSERSHIRPSEPAKMDSKPSRRNSADLAPPRARVNTPMDSAALVAPREASTPEQQAALADLDNGWTRERCLEAIAATGNIEVAAQVSGIGSRTVRYWMERDPAFREQVAQARRRCGQRVEGRCIQAVLHATDEQLLNHPVLPNSVINWMLIENRPGVTVNIDARSVNVTLLEPGQLERMKQALRASRLITREGAHEGGDPSSEGDDGER